MPESAIDPMEYATEFTFPVEGSEQAHLTVSRLRGLGWMIRGNDPSTHTYEVLLVEGGWIPLLAIDPRSDRQRKEISWDFERAIAVAHRFAAAGRRQA